MKEFPATFRILTLTKEDETLGCLSNLKCDRDIMPYKRLTCIRHALPTTNTHIQQV